MKSSHASALRDEDIPEHLKSKIYRTVIRSVALYGTECPVSKEVELQISGRKMRMLLWLDGITQLDRI
ncbi:hypothetical protein Y032_0138g2069 [Ancylostoma ceylanicum]|uniref:Uncharacterized protein n=1 Tax=Ancylostoma ceylanicum TaxID=53326 RepID=A0A016T536_9BILA|nr:hypothetical protein Y032_0138g2069 [Ancylostoma ceylanicum]